MNNSKLWICEKPKQGSLVASRIGITKREDGYIETKDGIVTWCVGHLVGFKDPADYADKWKSWSLDTLPIVPDKFDLIPLKGKEKQLKVIGKLLKTSNHVVIATDGDREGELLGREVLDYHNWSGQIERMWNTNLDDESIDNALSKIKPGEGFKGLYLAASARAEADYINGMSLTRAATKAFSNGEDVYSVGRVQTALLGMIVRRGHDINNFVSKTYYELSSSHAKNGTEYRLKYAPKLENRCFDKEKTNDLLQSIINKSVNLSVELKHKKTEPPQLFSLLSLQQAANKSLKWSASETKKIAQELYDNKLTSYPRTDCKFLPNEQEKDVKSILENLSKLTDFNEYIDTIGNDIPYRKTVFNTSKTTAHHAIIPTKNSTDLSGLSAKQKSLYLLIAKRYVASFMPSYEYDSKIVKYVINGCEFKGVGNTPIIQGWKSIYQSDISSKEIKSDDQVFPDLIDGEEIIIDKIDVLSIKTKPPARFNQSTLLSAMENISSLIEDENLKMLFIKRLKGKDKENAGIGTPATRDTFLDILVKRGYVSLDKNKIFESELGIKLVDSLPDKVSDPVETAVMESLLDDISKGIYEKNNFVDSIIADTTNHIDMIKKSDKQFEKEKFEYSCSKCQGNMLRKKGKFGFFWACNDYPKCTHTMLDKKGKPVERVEEKLSETPCPECGDSLVFRKSTKKGSSDFWGCTNYPKCKTTLPDDNGVLGKKTVMKKSDKQCPTCKEGNLVKRVVKSGKNKDKEFWGCSVFKCKHFDWVEAKST